RVPPGFAAAPGARRPPADPNVPRFGRGTSDVIAQDGGDVFAVLTAGYNFDGIQSPIVRRLGDPSTGPALFSVPSLYGTHGYDPLLPNLSAIFFPLSPPIRPPRLAH